MKNNNQNFLKSPNCGGNTPSYSEKTRPARTGNRLTVLAMAILMLLAAGQKAMAQCGQFGAGAYLSVSGWSVGSNSTSGCYTRESVVLTNTVNGATYFISLCGRGGGRDLELSVYNSGGTLLAYNDDACGGGKEPQLSFTSTGGDISLSLTHWNSCGTTGEYSSMYVELTYIPCTAAGTPGWASAYAYATSAATLSWAASGGTSTITYNWWLSNGASGSTTGTSVNVGSLSANTSYYMTVSASNCGGTSSARSSGWFTTYPDNPTGVTFGTNPVCNGGSTTLTASGVQGTVYWYTGGCGSTYVGAGNGITVYPTSTTTYYARNNNGNWSGGCASAQVTVNNPATVPATAAVTSTTQNTAALTWSASTGTATITHYWVVGESASVVYGTVGVAGVIAQGTTNVSTTTATATGLTASTNYYLRVNANSTASPCGASGYRTSVMFTTVPLAPVAAAQTLVRANSFTANWAASTGATKYYLDVATNSAFTGYYVSGYQNRDVGNVLTLPIAGLNRYTHYYYRVRACNAGGSSVNSSTIDFTTLPLNNFLIEKVGGGSIGVQMAGQAFNIRITARDAQNTTVTDYTGSSSAAISTNSVLTSGGTTANFVAGILASHSVTLTLSGAEKTLTASKTDNGSDVASTSTTFTVTPAALHHFTLTTQHAGTETAGTAFSVTATGFDVYNNIKTNYGGLTTELNKADASCSVNWSTTAASAPKGTARIIPANGNQTFTDGASTVTGFTFFNSDQTQLTPFTSPTITITDLLTGVTKTTAAITMLNAPLDNFKVVAGVTQIAGTAFTTTVTARDIYLNTCVDYAGNIRFKSSDDTKVSYPPGLQSFAPAETNRGVRVYEDDVLINKIGAYWLRAADASYAYKSGEQQNIVVRPGGFSPLIASGEIVNSTITVDSPDKIAGQEVKVTLIPRDAQGNLLYSCQTIVVLLDGVVKDGTHQEAHGTGSGEDGVYIFYVPVTSTTANNIISATLSGEAFAQTRDITVTPAPPSLANTLITPNAGSITTNGTQTITVQLYDKYNNKRTTNDGTVTLTTTLGSLVANNGSKSAVAVYGADLSGEYTATLYASFEGTSGAETGVGAAAISGSIAFNETPGPGDYPAGVSPYAQVAAPWPANGAIIDGGLVNITEGLPNLTTSTITTDVTTMTTDEHAHITVQLKDFLGNLITHSRGTVTLSSTLGALSVITDNNNGTYSAILSGNTGGTRGTGTATITGTFTGTGTASSVSGSFADNTTTVEITEGLPAVATIDISTAGAQITADDLTDGGKTVVTVQLKDALGNLIVNNRGTVTLSTNLGVIYNGSATGNSDVAAVYDTDGKYTATFKMSAIGVGTATITGKYNTAPITDDASVTVINGVATQLAISTPPAQEYQPIAGVVFNLQPVIYVKDHYGNLVVTGTGSDATVTATRITAGTAGLQGTTSKVAVAGIATFTSLSYNIAESIYIQFTSGSLTDQTSAAIHVVHNVPSYMIITGSGTQTAGAAQTITIRAYDFYGNLANRFTGTKSMTFTGANQSPVTSSYPTVNGTTFTNNTNVVFAAGEATASMVLYKEETAHVAANFTNASYVDAYTGTTSVDIDAELVSESLDNRLTVVVSQAAPTYLAVTGNATQVAGVPQTITIRAFDGFNNPATGYSGPKTLHIEGASVSLAPSTSPTADGHNLGSDTELTFTDGVATASLYLYKVESINIVATDQASPGITTPDGFKLAVNVTHAPANYYAVTGTGTQTAGASQNITVTAYDAFNNQATTYAGDIAVKFSGANPSPSTPGTATNPTVQNKNGTATDFGTATAIAFAGGVATRSMMLYKVETANIVATYYVGEVSTITTRNITDYDNRLQIEVSHAADSFFAVTGAGTQTAGVSQDITVTMYDAYNNVATSYAGSKSLTFSGANPSPNTPNAATNPIVNNIAFNSSTSLTFAAGTVTTAMNLYKVETALVTATNGTQTADAHKLSVVVSHADQNFMKITGSGTQTAGVSQNITITAYDAFNNVATRFDGSRSLSFSGASIAPAYSPTPATSPIVSATAFGNSTTLTFASGVVTCAMNLYKVETALVTATNTDGGITITADSHKLSVVVGQSTPAYLAVTGSTPQVAGASQTVTVTAYDAYNNVATGYTGSHNLIFTGPNPSSAASAGNNMPTPTTPATNPTVGGTAFGSSKSLTFASGVATASIILYKTETPLVSVTDGTINSNSSELLDHRLSVSVTPTLLYGFLVYHVPDPHDLGTWQPVTVKAVDTYNNLKTDYVGMVTFSNTDIDATNPADYQFVVGDAGVHNFTSAVKFSQVGLDWWLTAIDMDEPSKYGAQSGITVQRAVTITANNREKTYGDVLPMGTTEFTVSGIVSGVGPIEGEITGVTLTSAGSAATATVAGSQYTITPSAATGSYTAGLYRIVYSTSGRLTVNKRNLTLTNFLADNKTYDGTTDASGTGFSDNRVNSDVLTFGYTAAFEDRNIGTGKTVNYTGITISGGAGAGNYTLVTTSDHAHADIAHRDINVTAQTDTRIYNGTNSSAVLPVVGALQTGDEVTDPGIETFNNRNVGTSKVLTPSGTVISDGNGGANYHIAYVTDNTGVITIRTVDVTAQTDTRTYDGGTTSSILPVVSALQTDDAVSSRGTQSFDTKLVGTSKVLTPAGASINDGNSGLNYNINYVTNSTGVISQLHVDVTAATDTKTYDGNRASDGTVTVGDLAVGDVVNAIPTQTFDTKMAGTAKVMTPAGLTIKDGLSDDMTANYFIHYITNTTGVINQLHLDVTAATDSKTYDGDNTSDGSITLGDLASGDVVNHAPAQTYDDKNVGTGKVLTPAGLTIRDGVPTDMTANYDIHYVTNLTGEILQKALSVSAPTIASKVYNASATAGAVTVGTLSGFTGNETVTATATAADYSSKNVGTYPDVVVTYTLHDGTNGGLYSNYSLAAGSATGEITPKSLSVTAPSIASKVYDGDASAGAVTVGTVSGFIGTETVTATATAADYTSKNVGSYPDVVVTYTLHNGTNGGLYTNYSLASGSATGVVTRKALSVTAPAIASKVYNGTPTAGAVTVGTLSGFIGTETVTATASAANYPGKNIGTYPGNVVTYTLHDGTNGGLQANYSLADGAATGEITHLDVDVTAVTDTKIYDRNTTSDGIPTIGTLAPGDVVDHFPTQTYDNWLTAINKVMTPAGMTVKDALSADMTTNYDIHYLTNTTGEITPLAITGNFTVTSTRVYDGGTLATVLTRTLNNVINPDVVTLSGGTANYSNKNVGAGKTVTLTGMTLAGDDAFNYTLASVATVTAAITKKDLNLFTFAANSKTYDGNRVASGMGWQDDRLGSDELSFEWTAQFNSKEVGTAGLGESQRHVDYTSIVIFEGADKDNYHLVTTTGIAAANIWPKALTVTATGPTKVYGTALTAGTSVSNFTAGATGIGTETVTGVTLTPNAAGLSATTAAGTAYTVTPSLATGTGGFLESNYTMTYLPYNGTVSQAPLTILAANQSKVYGTTFTFDQTTPSDDFTVTGLLNSDAVTSITLASAGSAASATVAGSTYPIIPSAALGSGLTNYNIAYTNGSFTVTAKAIVITADAAQTKVYGATDPTFTYSNSPALESGGAFTGALGRAAGTNIGDYAYTLGTLSAGSNYSLSIAATPTFSITAKAIVITADAGQTKAYGATDPPFTYTNSPALESGGAFTGAPGRAAGTNIGDYAYTLGTLSAGSNYSLSIAATPTFSITPKLITVTASAGQTKVFGQTNPTPYTYTFAPVLEGSDVISGLMAREAGENFGTYAFSIGTLTAGGNYTLTVAATPTFSITAKTITIIPTADQSKPLSTADPVFAYSFTPALVSGDHMTGVLGRIAGEGVGYYEYTLGTLSAGTNYSLVMTASPATFAIIRWIQTIEMVSGWNIISSSILPSDLNLKTTFQPLIDGSKLRKVQDESGKAIEDWGSGSGGWKNGIGNFLATEGYRVNVLSACAVSFEGSAIPLPLEIPLAAGWNIISYPASGNQNGQEVVQALINAGLLVKVMDERGYAIEDWGTGFGWHNGIGDFMPGKGYLVRVNGTGTLSISEGGAKAATLVADLLASTHFVPVFKGHGIDHMNINVMEINDSGLKAGDEIAIFDGTVCVGAVTIGADQIFSGTMSIPVSANDGLSETINGFTNGNAMAFKLYRNGKESQLGTEVLNNGAALFQKGASLFIKASVNSDLGKLLDVKFYPNPFTDEISIEIHSPANENIDLMIYDVLGRKVRSLYQGSIDGMKIIRWNGTGDQGDPLKSGVYFMRCNGLTFNGIIKI